MNTDEKLVKISIPLKGSARESGFENESVWAKQIAADQYVIWNVPVFAYNIEMRAVVQCQPDPDGGLPIVTKVLSQGDCLGIRVYFDPQTPDENVRRVLDLFNSRDAISEKYDRNLWAFGLRTLADYEWVGPALQSFVEAGILNFESNYQTDEPTYDGSMG